MTCSYEYLVPSRGVSFRTGGMQFGLGLNLARYFSNKFILGVFFDAKGVKGFTRQKFSKQFVADFNNSFISRYSSQQDSARAYTVKDGVNGWGFGGNYLGNIGIMFSLFPQKYGGILLSVKKGYRSYPIHGTYGNPLLGNGEEENISVDLKNNYTFELAFKPYALFENSYVDFEEGHRVDF